MENKNKNAMQKIGKKLFGALLLAFILSSYSCEDLTFGEQAFLLHSDAQTKHIFLGELDCETRLKMLDNNVEVPFPPCQCEYDEKLDLWKIRKNSVTSKWELEYNNELGAWKLKDNNNLKLYVLKYDETERSWWIWKTENNRPADKQKCTIKFSGNTWIIRSVETNAIILEDIIF